VNQTRVGMVLARFQLLAGSRVALRALAPVAAGVVAASVMYGTPMGVVRLAQGLLVSPRVSMGCAVTVRDGRCQKVEMQRPGSESTEILERLTRGAQ
jgi:hypothetical protein